MSKYTIDALSLSHIGDLLRDRLGDDASQYLFPDDFEKAIVDIGFCGLVIDGDASPYDEIIFIGNIADKMMRPVSGTSNIATANRYKKATFIGTTNIPSYTFVGQTNLTTVDFGGSMTNIGSNAFFGCTSLGGDIVLPETVATLDKNVFANTAIESISGAGVTSIASATANNSTIFAGCGNLKTVYFPKLSMVTGTTTRGPFLNCTALQTVQIGSVGYGVTSITAYAFQGCSSVFTITIYTTGGSVDTLVTNVRSSCANATIVVKASADTTYDGVSYSAGATIKTSTP